MQPFWVAAAMTVAVNASTNPPSLLCKLSGAIPVGYGRGTPLRVGLINFVGLASRPAAAAIVRHARVSVVASEPRARAVRRGSVGVVICRTKGIRSTPVGTLTNIESVIVGGVIDV